MCLGHDPDQQRRGRHPSGQCRALRAMLRRQRAGPSGAHIEHLGLALGDDALVAEGCRGVDGGSNEGGGLAGAGGGSVGVATVQGHTMGTVVVYVGEGVGGPATDAARHSRGAVDEILLRKDNSVSCGNLVPRLHCADGGKGPARITLRKSMRRGAGRGGRLAGLLIRGMPGHQARSCGRHARSSGSRQPDSPSPGS